MAEGEFDLIARLVDRLPSTGHRLRVGSGDDAAIVEPGGALQATTVEAFVDGVHFRRDRFPPAAIGRKAVAATLSDLAAMGAEPGELYVALGVPPEMDGDDCLAILDGLAEAAAEWGAVAAGGDVSRAPVLFLAMTAVGSPAGPVGFVTRAGARPGDAVVVSGTLGGAAAGLLLLERDESDAAIEPALAAALCARQLAPVPRLREGALLAAAGASAMVDISDGLIGDAAHLAAAGGVRIELDAAIVPIQEGVAEVAAAMAADAQALAVAGGEDYELLACVPAERLAAAIEALAQEGASLTRVGEVASGPGVELLNATAAARAARGFDQLRSRAEGGHA